jgi:hypothetical protein
MGKKKKEKKVKKAELQTCACGHHADDHSLEFCHVYRSPLDPNGAAPLQFRMRCSGFVAKEDEPTVFTFCPCTALPTASTASAATEARIDRRSVSRHTASLPIGTLSHPF